MKPCEAHRDELLEAVLDGAAALSPELAAHLAACTPCGAERARHARLAQDLGSLARRAAPAQLDARLEADMAGRPTERAVSSQGLLRPPAAPADLAGLVGSAMNAGHRQDRAAAWVVGLAPRPAPGALDGRVRELPARQPAPGVLDRLVAEELADPAKSMASRFLGRLERRSAPRGLERRLVRARGEHETPSRTDGAGRRLAVVSSLLAAALLAWFGVARTTDTAQEAPNAQGDLALEFRVERVRSIDELGPVARGLVGLVSDVQALDLGEAR
jgi:hypothetical protein